MLFLEPFGGLCNRLRALDAAISVSQLGCQDLSVIWLLNEDINCCFSDLFYIPPELLRLWEIRPGKLKKAFTAISRLYFSNFGNIYLDQSELGIFQQDKVIDLLIQYQSVYLNTCSQFYIKSKKFRFFPKEFLQDQISTCYTQDMVGVHIRRQDNVLSIQHSPIQGFISCMEDEIRADCDVRFFVATDDREAEKILKSRFPQRIITHPKRSLSRSNPLAIEDAVIDLYCLANCRKLIGSYWSSFTDFAWQMNDIDKIIVKLKELPD